MGSPRSVGTVIFAVARLSLGPVRDYLRCMSPGSHPKQRAQFFRELAQLTAAGISVTQAAKVLGQDWRDATVRGAVAQMERGLTEGGTIAGALSPSLTAMEHSVIGAAERGGKLSQGFRHLEEYYHLLDQTLERVRGALLYPLFMLHAAVLLPALVSAVTTKTSIAGALLTRLAWIWGGLAVLWFGGQWLSRLARTSSLVDGLLQALPWVGSTRRGLALARWHAVMHFNIASGQRIAEGLREAGLATASARLEAASRTAAQAVDDGSELGTALIGQAAFPREMAGALAAAEFTGTLDTETQRWSRQSMTEAASMMEISSKRICAAFYGVVVLFTVWQILQMVGNYVGMYQQAFKDLGI